MVGVSWSHNNHDVCEQNGLNTFKHLVNTSSLSFFFSLISKRSPCLLKHSLYFEQFSSISKLICKMLKDTYSVDGITSNDRNALRARINFVERIDDQRRYMPILHS